MKLTASPTPADMARLDKAAEMIGASRRILVSQLETSVGRDARVSCNLAGLLARLREWPT